MPIEKSVPLDHRAAPRIDSHTESAGSWSSIDLEAIKIQAEANGLTLEEEEPRDAWGLSPKVAASQAAFEFLRMFEVGFGKWTKVPPIIRHITDTTIGKTGMSSRLLCSNALIREVAAHIMIDVVI